MRRSGFLARALSRGCALLAAGALALLAGCAVTPQSREALATYGHAMEQVDRGASELLGDFARVLAPRPEAFQPGAASEFPDKFVPPEGFEVTEETRTLRFSLHALQVVRAYNQQLLALAEGRPIEQVRAHTAGFAQSLQQLGTLFGAAVPGLNAVTAIAPGIVKLAQDALHREQLVQAARAGHEPVSQILEVLVAQTGPLYRDSRATTMGQQVAARVELQRAVQALRRSMAQRAAPTDPNVARNMVAMQGRVAELVQRMKADAVLADPLVFQAGQPAFDALAESQAGFLLKAMEASEQRYAELVARQNDYFRALQKYAETLGLARRSLDAFVRSLDAPVDLAAEGQRLLASALELRDTVTTFRQSQRQAALRP